MTIQSTYLRTGRDLDVVLKLTDEQRLALQEHELISLAEDDELASDTVAIWEVSEAAQDGHQNPLTPEDLLKLPHYWEIRDKRGRLTDTEAMDLLHFMYSAPEWSSSFNEDARGIITRTGRKDDIGGAQWDRH